MQKNVYPKKKKLQKKNTKLFLKKVDKYTVECFKLMFTL